MNNEIVKIASVEVPPKVLPRHGGSLVSIFLDTKKKQIYPQHNNVNEFTEKEKNDLKVFVFEYIKRVFG